MVLGLRGVFLPKPTAVGGDALIEPSVLGDNMEHGPHRICRSGRHCIALTGITADGRCLECRRESHRRAQAAYQKTERGVAAHDRYEDSAKGNLRDVRYNATRRGK